MEDHSLLSVEGGVGEPLSSKTDLELVDAAKKDPEIFGLLMERFEKPLLRYLVRLTGWAEAETEDMLQETFIKAYRNLNDFDPELKFSSWLYRIAHNQAIDTLRHHSARPTMNMLPMEDIARFIPADTDVERELASRYDMEKVRQAILDLPLRYREVLILRFLEDKDYEEIMDILKKPKGTVATLIKRGRTILIESLKE
ncbi:MAG: sigma-70 family RNA polymerase sigma factor [Candidatus Moraniibacteriota bacterium]